MYTRYATPFERLSGGEMKLLMSAIFAYVENGEIPDVSQWDNFPRLDMAWAMVKDDLDRDGAKWEDAKTRMSEAGKKGMASRWGKGNTE